MRRKIHFLLFLFLCMASIPLAAQDIEVKGVVTEATTNEPLPGVTVRVKDKDTGTITDADGKYSIKAGKGNTLVFSTIGMKQIEKKVHTRADSNRRSRLRRAVLYPLSYGCVYNYHMKLP